MLISLSQNPALLVVPAGELGTWRSWSHAPRHSRASSAMVPASCRRGSPLPVQQACWHRRRVRPVQGSAEVVQGLLTGSIEYAFDGVVPYLSLIERGQMRALAKLDSNCRRSCRSCGRWPRSLSCLR